MKNYCIKILNGFETTQLWMDRSPAANSTFAIGRVSCSVENLVQVEDFLLRINISGKNPAHRKSAKR